MAKKKAKNVNTVAMRKPLTPARLQMAQYPKGDDRLVVTRETLGALIDVTLYAKAKAERSNNDDRVDQAVDVLAGLRNALGKPEEDELALDDDDLEWEDEDVWEGDEDTSDDDDELWDDDEDVDDTDDDDFEWE
jgi:hypothetical protein